MQDLYKYRDLIKTLVIRDLKVRYRGYQQQVALRVSINGGLGVGRRLQPLSLLHQVDDRDLCGLSATGDDEGDHETQSCQRPVEPWTGVHQVNSNAWNIRGLPQESCYSEVGKGCRASDSRRGAVTLAGNR